MEIIWKIRKNWGFGVIFLGIVFLFFRRYVYLPMAVVSQPDSQISFSTQDGVMEQTWQPTVKGITGVKIPYFSEDDFSCDIQLKIFSDDRSESLVDCLKRDHTFAADEAGNIEFDFKRKSLIQGERYRIQISLLNASSDGTLQIASGSNYGGCSVSGKEVGQAAALTVTFAKYSRLFWMMAVLFPLASFSLLSMTITGKKWEETVGISLFWEGIILYCFGCLERLALGLNVVYVLAIGSALAAVILFNIKKRRVSDLLSPGLWIYGVLFGLIIFINNGDWLGYRDELRHWGIAVRDMFFYDSFAKHAGTTVILPRYLPFTALIEYVFEYMNGVFNESILFVSYQTMVLSVLIIVCRLLQKKGNIKLAVPVMVTMICVPVIFFNNISNSIMVDSLLAAIAAYVLICYYTDEMTWFNRVRIVSALVALTLIKDMGLILAGMIVLIMFGDILLSQIRDRKLNIKQFIYPVICGFLALAVYFSWQIYLSIPARGIAEPQYQREEAPAMADSAEGGESNEINTENEKAGEEETETVSTAIAASGITVDGLRKVLSGQGEEYQYQVTRNFLIELFQGETYPFVFSSLSFFKLFFVILFIIGTLGYFGYWRENRKRMYGFAGLSLFAGVFLCAFLQITYWFSFTMYDALELTSFDRYLAPYICALLITVLYLVFDGLQNADQVGIKEKYMVFAISVFLIISMPVEGVVIEGKDIEGNTTDEITYGHSNLAEILRSVAKRGERAFFICSNSDGYSEYVFRNAICPVISEHANWNIVSSEEISMKQYDLYGEDGIDDNAANILSCEAWKSELKKCQYLVIFHADELFLQSYSELFKDMAEIEDGSVYQIVDKEEEVSFRLIGKTGIKGWH